MGERDPVELGEGKLTFPCEQCGSALEFSPGTDRLKCPHCGHTQVITGDKAVFEHDFEAMKRKLRSAPATSLVEGGHNVQCEGCGAQTVIAGQAGRCPFCGSPVVVDVAVVGEIVPPESVLPFGIAQAAAQDAFQKWVGSLWFAPGDLRRLATVHKIDGVYLPYWTYDSQTTTRYTGQRGEHYYVTESYTDAQGKSQTRQVQKTRWYSARGSVQVAFDDVLVCGSSTLPRALIEKLEPWDLDKLRGFDPAFLSGFVAERYKVGLEDGFQIAEERMEPKIRAEIRSDIGGDEQRILSMAVRHADVKVKHVLLPLWISSFRYKEKVYRFIVNARSGEVAGERPWSAWKIALTVIVVIAAIVGIVIATRR